MCIEAPALIIEKNRLAEIGGQFLGIVGDANHTYGYHVCNPAPGDYSLDGILNREACGECSCAIDIGMNWSASRRWLRWLVDSVRNGSVKGVGEIIGSFDSKTALYWAYPDFQTQIYTGNGHVSWTHVACLRSTAYQDHKILAGWTADGYEGDDDMSWLEETYEYAPEGWKFSGKQYLFSTYGSLRDIKKSLAEAAARQEATLSEEKKQTELLQKIAAKLGA